MERVKKVGIIGAGHVGSTLAFILSSSTPYEIVLQDKDKDRARGMLLDMFQASCIGTKFTKLGVITNPKDLKGCDLIVIAAGSPRLPGMSRNDLLFANAKVISEICKDIKENSPESILLLVTNPLDAMVYTALKETGFKNNQILGMAGVLDSARMASFIYEKLQCAPGQIVAPVMGGHGDDMVPLARFSSVNGVPLSELLSEQEIEEVVLRTRNAGAEIVSCLKKGSAYFAPARATAEMVIAIMSDSHKILPSAVYLNGEYGYRDVVAGVPVELGRNGVERIVELTLNEKESSQFANSVNSVKTLIDELNSNYFK
ncbi:malate dehydrogenase [Helicobacter sp. WB40]|uniref:malate dehydrogenase n=1 Tax=Helicobacter sp. WB40 TaxID=3004130 RepID=UPI0022EBC53A|nr:malate dehydrogenase [Helicobacter sp. WB40]MDA3966586.1 malate dehydrogenase [Helicobacter sp. WB40]